MIIVPQSQETLLPLESAEKVFIHQTDMGYCIIRAQLRANEFVTLGAYKDHDRAKEVLEEITDIYASYKYIPGGPMATADFFVQPQAIIPPKAYRMPEG